MAPVAQVWPRSVDPHLTTSTVAAEVEDALAEDHLVLAGAAVKAVQVKAFELCSPYGGVP